MAPAVGDGRADVAADVGITLHEGVIGKSRIFAGIGNDKGYAGREHMRAKAEVPRSLRRGDADGCLGPLTIFSNKVDLSATRSTDQCCQFGNIVESLLRERIKNVKVPQ